jgi:hypothetical protein
VLGFKREILEQKTGTVPLEGRSVEAPSGPVVASAAPPSTRAATVITATLGDLARLRDAGAITGEEYEAKKTELLARL